MNPIKNARIMRGMNQKTLAEKLGVAPQTLNTYESGLRRPGNKLLPKLAETLNVSSAYLLGEAESIPVVDFMNGNVIMCQIVSCEEIEGYGAFYIVDCEPVGLIACILADGVQFTQSDWQGEQCREAEDIAEYHWLDAHGNAAVMLDGLPRMFA